MEQHMELLSKKSARRNKLGMPSTRTDWLEGNIMKGELKDEMDRIMFNNLTKMSGRKDKCYDTCRPNLRSKYRQTAFMLLCFLRSKRWKG